MFVLAMLASRSWVHFGWLFDKVECLLVIGEHYVTMGETGDHVRYVEHRDTRTDVLKGVNVVSLVVLDAGEFNVGTSRIELPDPDEKLLDLSNLGFFHVVRNYKL